MKKNDKLVETEDNLNEAAVDFKVFINILMYF